MHVADEGCVLAAGQVLWEALPCYDRTNQEGRARLLWEHNKKKL
jgi:hypothetical protein